LINGQTYAILRAGISKGVPNLSYLSEQELLHEIESLRQELDQIVQERPELLGSQRVYALSARLDALIASYMKLVAQKENSLR
jgi:hypothetical protein